MVANGGMKKTGADMKQKENMDVSRKRAEDIEEEYMRTNYSVLICLL